MKSKVLVAAAAVGLLGLTGCGTPQAGVAAEVGDQTITVDQVSTLTRNFCGSVERQLTGQNQQMAMSTLSALVLQGQVMKAAAEQLAAEWDVEPSTAYFQTRSSLTQGLDSVNEAQADAYVEVQSSFDYVNDVVNVVAGASLEADGVDSPSAEEQSTRAKEVFATWIAVHQPEINPKYGLAIIDIQPAVVDTSTSVAVSTLAKNAGGEQPDAGYVADLPADQRCG